MDDPKVRIAWTRVRELDAKTAGAKHKARALKKRHDRLQERIEQLVDGDTDPAALDKLDAELEALLERRTQAKYRLKALREEAARAWEQARLLEESAGSANPESTSAASGGADTTAPSDAGGDTPPVRLRFASLPAFVESYVLPNWRHPLNEVCWCARWWEHAEAISRLSACWEAFEVMRREPAPALSVWWRDHLDVHMAALTRVTGPFKQCDARKGTHRQQPIWDTAQPPAGLFPVDENAEIGGHPAATKKEAG